jgi:acetyl esterase/lipase
MPKLIVLLMLLLMTPGCSLRFTVLNATVCPFTNTKTTDIAFGKLDRQKLDVYKPRTPNPNTPIVIFFYGGAWQEGEKSYYKFAAEALTSRGYIAVVPDYRLYPQTSFPNFLHDCALAVKWTKDHAKEIGGDESKIFLMGHSAGAYNAVMISLDPRYLNEVGLTQSDIRGTIGLAGPYDFFPTP